MEDIVSGDDLEKININEYRFLEILGNPGLDDDKIDVSLPNSEFHTNKTLRIQANYSISDCYLEDTLTKVLSLKK